MKQRKTILGYLKSKFAKINQISLVEGSDIARAGLLQNVVMNGKVILEEGVSIVHGVNIAAISEVTVGKHTIINGPNTNIRCRKNKVTIGKYCSIARNVSIQEFNHNHKCMSTSFALRRLLKGKQTVESKGDITIENDVWIASQCIILSGVRIHSGAIIAANSVVNKDVPPYAIVGGTPAKVIGYRFDKEVIERLLAIKWWDWEQTKLEQHRELLLKEEINLNDVETIANSLRNKII